MFRPRQLVAVAVVAFAAASCTASGSDTDASSAPPTAVPTIAGVGSVPVAPSAIREPVVVVQPPLNDDGSEAELIGAVADGNRVLMIGDSILASTSSRYGNQMCNALVPLGWQVAVEAEPSRFIEFGNQVLDKLLPENGAADAPDATDWDAAVVFLGSNYRGNPLQYEAELTEILDRLTPRPILLSTVTEYRPDWVEVNEVVRRLGASYDNVNVLDWEAIARTPGVLSADGLHPTDAGRKVLAESVAVALGPVFGEGACLRSSFRDDSAIDGDTATVLGGRSTSGTRASTTTPTSPTTTVVRTTAATTTIASITTVPTTTQASTTPATTPTTPTTPTTATTPTTQPVTTPPASGGGDESADLPADLVGDP